MKAEDLMIGDWVKCTDPRCEGHQVDLMDHGNEEVGLDGEIDNFENIIPIPLTPEILEKNGWKQKGYFYYSEELNGRIQLGELFEHASIVIDDCRIQLPTYRIKYVHELQHALRLCGIDKEIVL